MNYKQGLTSFLNFLEHSGMQVDQFSEFKYETLRDFSVKGSKQGLVNWYYNFVTNSTMKLERIDLMECEGWSYDNSKGYISHKSGEFFRVEGYRVTGTSSREVLCGWDQPFLTQEGFDGGILGLLRKRFDGIPHYLIEAKEEPGNYNVVQISPTVQATFSNLKRAHKGNKTSYSDLFINPQNHPVSVILEQWTSEDGGRLFNKRNKTMLIEFDENTELAIDSERFKWVSLFQLKALITEEDAIIAPHIRGILAAI